MRRHTPLCSDTGWTLMIPETVLKRVFVVVKGGLGNQMFQAALGVAIEAATGASVNYIVDDFSFDSYGRKFLLDAFPSLSGRRVDRKDVQGSFFLLMEDESTDIKRITEIVQEHDVTVLDGYWQSERYFSDFSAHVKRSFLPGCTSQSKEEALAQNHPNSIGLHVRRFDYGHHGLARTRYYKECINYIRRTKGEIAINVFSDEINFCRYAFRDIKDCRFFSGDQGNPLDDFWNLSRNTHFILANSSFSWWAAWLGERDGSIVCAPQPWCVFEEGLNPAPDHWIKVLNAVQEQ